ncbi:polysaccharide deacetylase family protein [Catellatospora coxensis]
MSVYLSSNSAPTQDELAVTSRLSGRRPVGRWLRRLVAGVLVGVFVTLLLVQAYTNASFAPDSTTVAAGSDAAVPAQVRDGGPAITTTGRPATTQPARDRIALTFDDGPDPVWTPQILDLLAHHRVQATFFVVGAQAARYPDLTRRIVAEGHEVGVHTFTHPDLTAIGPWRRSLEYSLTQLAIAHATGVKTTLFRPPYSSSPDAVRDADWRVLQEAGAAGYLTVLENADSRDWARPGQAAIVANATPVKAGRSCCCTTPAATGHRPWPRWAATSRPCASAATGSPPPPRHWPPRRPCPHTSRPAMRTSGAGTPWSGPSPRPTR